jgi:hypothetical protein
LIQLVSSPSPHSLCLMHLGECWTPLMGTALAEKMVLSQPRVSKSGFGVIRREI